MRFIFADINGIYYVLLCDFFLAIIIIALVLVHKLWVKYPDRVSKIVRYVGYIGMLGILIGGIIIFANLDSIKSAISDYQIRSELGREIGVDYHWDYADIEIFPVDYFAALLDRGMDKTEVRKIITGYEAFYACASEDVYHFYSADVTDALRMKIVYDENDKYKESIVTIPEIDVDRFIPDDCELIEENNGK